jgi:hypothetical protein
MQRLCSITGGSGDTESLMTSVNRAIKPSRYPCKKRAAWSFLDFESLLLESIKDATVCRALMACDALVNAYLWTLFGTYQWFAFQISIPSSHK